VNRSQKNDTDGIGQSPWEIVYILLCLVLLVLTAFQFSLFATGKTGWDYETYVSAIQTFNHGQNPYILENIIPYQQGGTQLQFDYPPHTLYFFWLLDFILVFHYTSIYYSVLLVLFIISAYLIVHLDEKRHYLFLTTLLLTGFMGAIWNFVTGNIPILFLFLFAVIFTFMIKGKYWQSSVVMGLSAAVSLFTVPFIVLFLLVRRSIIDRLSHIFLSLGIIGSLFIVDYLVNPAYIISYVEMMIGGNSPLSESGGWNQPTPYLLFRDTLNGSFGGIIPFIAVSCIYIGLILYATGTYYRKNKVNFPKTFSLVMLSIFMILPRLMPYDFIILVIPLYILFKDCSYQMKSLVLFVISLPFFVWYSQFFGISGLTLAPYIQTYSLILVFLVVIFNDHLAPASDTEGKPGEKTEKNSHVP